MTQDSEKYLLTKSEIEDFEGLDKTHFLNTNAKRNNKSLGDLTGLNNLGFHIIEVAPGHASTELHRHFHEEECIYMLEGTALATIGQESVEIGPGDFIGYRAGGLPHKLENVSDAPFKCIVVGQRLAHDVADYPAMGKRIYRNVGMPWNLVDVGDVEEPKGGRKV